jgi:hypothetical protein
MREGNKMENPQEYNPGQVGEQNVVSKNINKLLEWERKKFIKMAQKGLILLIFGIVASRIIIILASFNYYGAAEAFDVLYKVLSMGAIIIFYLGALFFLLAIFTLAIRDEELHIYLRVAMIIAMGLIIYIPMSTGFGYI